MSKPQKWILKFAIHFKLFIVDYFWLDFVGTGLQQPEYLVIGNIVFFVTEPQLYWWCNRGWLSSSMALPHTNNNKIGLQQIK